jgi:hypothetical protein
MIKSNILKEVPYPDGFTEEDKIYYDQLYAQAKLIHADVERENPFIIHTAIIGYIRANKGLAEPFTNEELEAVKNSYKLKSKIVECNEDENSFLYDKENNPIYFPAKLTISADDDEKKNKVILEA